MFYLNAFCDPVIYIFGERILDQFPCLNPKPGTDESVNGEVVTVQQSALETVTTPDCECGDEENKMNQITVVMDSDI